MPFTHVPLFAQAFADQCRRWARQSGAAAESANAAYRAGLALAEASSAGHTCLPLARLGLERQALLASGVAGEAESGKPLILDAGDRLYLARHFDAETRLAAALLARHHHRPAPPGAAAQQRWRDLFADAPPGDGQALAVALALCRRLVVISGGPGTGKTTTVARLLACLLADAPEHEVFRIALAAPTGKAAARLQESLLAHAGAFLPSVAERLPQQASTLHRLLGLRSEGDTPRYHRDNPLPVEALVIDEASMLDLNLALQVCEALPTQARLVLLGDKHQLQAVETGAVFAALSQSATLTPQTQQQLADLTGWPLEALDFSRAPSAEAAPALQDAVVWLTQSRRFAGDSALGCLAAALAQGEGEAALALFSTHADLRHLESDQRTLTPEEAVALEDAYAPYRQALMDWRKAAPEGADGNPLAPLFAAFGQFRALCVTRQGGRGVEGVNAHLERVFRRLSGSMDTPAPFSGQPVMILKNDPATGLFNGDLGIALADKAGMGVWFPNAPDAVHPPGNAPAVTPYRRLTPQRLPAWESAFAMTAHKAQGSEFEKIALVLPEKDLPLLCRELLYTAITRARQGVLLLGPAPLFQTAARRQALRDSGLAARLCVGS
ncbi:MAG: exodeoxyribonuclease V subunit alpha [Zoogloeaceae bacterium]|nr:exodeoxyribonuclease V subunit alpha [Zoogloeaceae bacterium]